MGFNSGFKGLKKILVYLCVPRPELSIHPPGCRDTAPRYYQVDKSAKFLATSCI